MGFFRGRQDGRLDMAEQINQPDFSLPTDGTQASDIGRQVCFSFLLFFVFFLFFLYFFYFLFFFFFFFAD